MNGVTRQTIRLPAQRCEGRAKANVLRSYRYCGVFQGNGSSPGIVTLALQC